ncbi:MAG: DNRLRE domain-containing protein [Phycisphaerales bacterium]|nr:DNRLRE domain-containing protein [Phycisphaerales bacterium]
MNTRTALTTITLGLIGTPLLAGTTVYTDRDYMTSGFFSMDPAVRGDNDGREINRVSSIQPFGVFDENTYLEFNDYDWSTLGGPVDSAVFRIEVVSGGFGADSSEENPFDISLHSLSQDPWTTIDPTLFSGPASYQGFAADQINSASVISTTSVGGAGIYEWDITSLVNDWIANGDANFAQTIALSGILDASGGTFLQGLVNSTSPSLIGDEVIGQIVVVPAPAGLLSFAAFGVIASRRRRG